MRYRVDKANRVRSAAWTLIIAAFTLLTVRNVRLSLPLAISSEPTQLTALINSVGAVTLIAEFHRQHCSGRALFLNVRHLSTDSKDQSKASPVRNPPPPDVDAAVRLRRNCFRKSLEGTKPVWEKPEMPTQKSLNNTPFLRRDLDVVPRFDIWADKMSDLIVSVGANGPEAEGRVSIGALEGTNS